VDWKAIIQTIVLFDRLGVALGFGGISAILFGLWASMSNLPPVIVALVGLAALTLSVLAINGWRAYLKNRGQNPDYARWDLVNNLTLAQAAELWEEQDPIGLGRPNMESYPRYRMLHERAVAGELRVDNPTVGIRAMVTRQELIRFANSLGERPKFLFRDAR
jgi:hypothetical protein